MTFIDALAKQVPDWPRDTLAADFAAAVRNQIGSTLSAAPGRPCKDAPVISFKRRVRKAQPLRPEVLAMFEARRAA